MSNKINLDLYILDKNEYHEIQVDDDLTVDEIRLGLVNAYHLYGNSDDYCLVSENPIGLLQGNKKLSDYKLHNASKIIYKKK
ncbi:MAG: hypothetical protein J6X97_04420 [Lachnospiraceae bacterium]|nr:hypothetical protein [Lachnospiraceae bacterium]